MPTYNNYPRSASSNAQRALDYQSQNQTDCGTAVGWARARQLANRETITIDTVKRTFSFLSRAKVYDTGSFEEDGRPVCGSIMYAAWGGDEMRDWSERTIETWNKEQNDMNTNRAEAGELSVGDAVSWRSGEGRAYGVIVEVAIEGELSSSTGFVMEGTPDDPVAQISIYDKVEGGYLLRQPVELVVHRFSTLTEEDDDLFFSESEDEERNERRAEKRYYTRNDAAPFGESDARSLVGYGVVFDDEYELGEELYERIAPDALELAEDVLIAWNHNYAQILGRTGAGTATVEVDERGAKYEVKELPNTTYANDLIELLRTKNVTGSSFSFYVEDEEYKMREDGAVLRTIKKAYVFEMGPVTMPAYKMTTANLRAANVVQQRAKEMMQKDSTITHNSQAQKKADQVAARWAELRKMELDHFVEVNEMV